MPNPENVTKNKIKTTSEARKRGRAGGKKSVEVRRQKKNLKETLKLMLEMEAPMHLKQEIAEKVGLDIDTFQDLITGGLINKAMSGDSKAFEVLRDTIGEKPKEEVSYTKEIVYVDPDEKENMNKHIDDVINDSIG